MTNNEIKPNKGSCCCCFGETDLVNMLEPQDHDGNIEVYTSMINDCYGIEMYVDIEEKIKNLLMICNLCTSRLRNALQFKNEVQNAYDRIRDYLYSYSLSKIKTEYSDRNCPENEISLTSDVKVEPRSEHENDNSSDIFSRDVCKPFDNSNSLIWIKAENTEKKEDQSIITNIKTEESQLGLNDMHQKKFQNYSCDLCSKSFILKVNFNRHMRYHKDLQMSQESNNCEKLVKENSYNKYKCPKCPERFVNFQQRIDHLINIHNDETQIHRCKYCNKDFKIKSKLKRHVDSVHLNIRRFACEVCSLRFFRNGELKNHMLCHTHMKHFHCDVCKRAFSRKQTLYEHMKIHSNIKKFTCDICNKAFIQKSSLIFHLNTHYNRNRRKAVSVVIHKHQ